MAHPGEGQEPRNDRAVLNPLLPLVQSLHNLSFLLDEHVLRARIRHLRWLERKRAHAGLAQQLDEHEQSLLQPGDVGYESSVNTNPKSPRSPAREWKCDDSG